MASALGIIGGAQNNASQLTAINPTLAGGSSSVNQPNFMGGLSAINQPNLMGGSSVVAQPAPIKDQINSAYLTHFGRPADDAGMSYWMNAANRSPNSDIGKMIGDGAQTQDRAAQASINAGGVDTTHTWNPSLNTADVAPQKDIWDASTNSWKSNSPVSAVSSATPASAVNFAPTASAMSSAPHVVSSYTPEKLGTPNQWNITSDQTTQGQMQHMIDPNNPYYQAWKNAGANDATSRGFNGNSSIRDSAILDAVMRNATPIAQSDAAINAKSVGYNADMMNQFAIHNQDAANTASQFNSGQANQMTQAHLQADTSRYSTDMNARTSKYGTDSAAESARYTANVSADTQKFIAGQSSQTQKDVAGLNNLSQKTISDAHDANAVLLSNNKAAQDALSTLASGMNINDNNKEMQGSAKSEANNILIRLYNNNPVNLANPNFVPTAEQVYDPTHKYDPTLPPSQDEPPRIPAKRQPYTQTNSSSPVQDYATLPSSNVGSTQYKDGVPVYKNGKQLI